MVYTVSFLHIFIRHFLYILVFITQNIVDPNILKIARTGDCCARKKQIFFNFSSLTQYFIHEFLLYSFTRSFIRLPVRSFFIIFFIIVYIFSLCLTFIIRQVQSASSLFPLFFQFCNLLKTILCMTHVDFQRK